MFNVWQIFQLLYKLTNIHGILYSQRVAAVFGRTIDVIQLLANVVLFNQNVKI